ncbi:MAG: ABC transporter permease [Paludibacteraceae bacterium]|nr:ABC transporter permease [Paludibacteraceae bacterium]
MLNHKEIFARFRAVIKRELSFMLRRPIYVFSAVFTMVFCSVFFFTLMDEGAPVRMPIAVVDHDQSVISRRFIHELNATQGTEVAMVVPTHQEARRALQSNDVYAFIEIPENFYADLLAFRRPQVVFYVNYGYSLGGNQSYKQLLTMANLASGAFQQEMLKARGKDSQFIDVMIQPIVVNGHMLTNTWSNYAVYLLSTLLPGIFGLVILMLTIFSIGYELKSKTSREWLDTAGHNFHIALIGKMIPYSILYMSIALGMVVMFFKFMHFPLRGSLINMFIYITLFTFAMQAMAVTWISVFPVLRDAVSAGALYGMLSFSLSGFTYPVMAMLPFVQALTYLFPLRYYYMLYVNEALNGAPASMSIPLCLALLAFPLIAVLLQGRLHRALIYQNYPLS